MRNDTCHRRVIKKSQKMTLPSSPAELPELGAAVLGSPGDVLAELEPGPSQHPRLAPHLLPLLVFSKEYVWGKDFYFDVDL